MQWWNNFVEWFYSEDGWRVVSGAVIPFVAIVLAGFIAAMIGRGSTRRLIALHDRERRIATVTALIGAARRASKWNTLSVPEQQHAEHLAHEADVSVRLLPLGGAMMTADWAAHEIAEMKKNSVSFSFQAEQSLVDFRDRLVEWQTRPSRAKKLFKADLDLWAYESAQDDQDLVQKQQAWAKQQVATETGPVEIAASSEQPLVWDKPATTQAASAQSATVQANTVQANSAQSSAAHSSEEKASHEMPAISTVAATPTTSSTQATAPTSYRSETPELITPNPVSANTVRQRNLPNIEDDDIR